MDGPTHCGSLVGLIKQLLNAGHRDVQFNQSTMWRKAELGHTELINSEIGVTLLRKKGGQVLRFISISMHVYALY